MSIRFDSSVCGDLEEACSHEWLETNGLGGFASSTIVGLNTRRYHGLLVAATDPPVGRTVLLAKLEETIVVKGERFELSANQYPGVIHPTGFLYMVEFRLDPFPVFLYRVGGVEIEKSVFMVHGENTVVVEYRMSRPATLELRPLAAFRDYHSLTRENGAWNSHVDLDPGRATINPYGLPLYFAHNADSIDASQACWYRNFEYSAELARGLDWQEDLFNPFTATFETTDRATVIASTRRRDVGAADDLKQREAARRAGLTTAVSARHPLIQTLTRAADQFIVQRGDQKTVIAGYHWFGDWGRDTMISLPGLTLVTGRPEVARSILLTFAKYVNQGMLPNRFPDSGQEPEYNTVDATLWFFEAIRAYLVYTSDSAFVMESLFPVLRDIVDWHLRGTRYGIHAGPDGLISCGEPGVQLTWMDAKVGDWVVTPRMGKPVEIQALWYNALCLMDRLAGEVEPRYARVAAQVRESFNEQFWNEDTQCLYDVTGDPSIRPNQIFAVSLPYCMLPMDRARKVVATVARELLTPMGLRTLSPADPRYRGRYEGDVRSRDGAYHQGTVWPWLMGPFLRAYLKTGGDPEQARAWILGFDSGLGQICEIADGDEPYAPKGCIAQAWSVAELLRSAVEDVGL